jgi:formylmethanofuran dehydrogenase subunit E
MKIGEFMRDKQMDKPLAYCSRCGGEQYREDYMYIFEGHRICGECMGEKFDCLTVREKADLLGAASLKAGE